MRATILYITDVSYDLQRTLSKYQFKALSRLMLFSLAFACLLTVVVNIIVDTRIVLIFI